MFLFLVSQKLNDGSTPIAVYKADTLDNAYMQLHQTMASAYANENMVSCLAQVMNENGTICKSDFFDRTPEPEETEPAAGE